MNPMLICFDTFANLEHILLDPSCAWLRVAIEMFDSHVRHTVFNNDATLWRYSTDLIRLHLEACVVVGYGCVTCSAAVPQGLPIGHLTSLGAASPGTSRLYERSDCVNFWSKYPAQ